jgi:hypothetical protein
MIICSMKETFALTMTLMLMFRFVSTGAWWLAYRQTNTTSGNVTAQLAPQGTSLNGNSSKGNMTVKR